MICPNCHREAEQNAVYCANCGTRLINGYETEPDRGNGTVTTQAVAGDPPRKRQTFLGIYSFVLALYCAWSAFVLTIMREGLVPFGIYDQFQKIIIPAAFFVCGGTAVLAFCSLLLKRGKKGLGTAALILSLISLLVTCIPALVGAHKAVQTDGAEREGIAVVSDAGKQETRTNESTDQDTIEKEGILFRVEQLGDTEYLLTIDNRSDRDVNFDWVGSKPYALLTTDQGKYRADITESEFRPVKAYTERTVTISFDRIEGQPQSIEIVNLIHLNSRGLPSFGTLEGIRFRIQNDE